MNFMKAAGLSLFFLSMLACAQSDEEPAARSAASPEQAGGGDAAAQDAQVVQDAQTPQADDPENPDDVAARIRLRDVSVDQITAPFTRATVLKLNAIVQRSLDTIDAYDARLDAMRAAIDAAAANGASDAAIARARAELAALAALKSEAAAAKSDMADAVATLKASDENYNENILEGMIIFVRRVDAEIAEEFETQASRV